MDYYFTVSCGLAECALNDDAPNLIIRADRRLYEGRILCKKESER